MSTLDYVQPVQTSNSASNMAATPLLPAVIKDYDANDTNNTTNDCLPTYAPHWPKKPPTLPLPVYDMLLIPPPAYSVSLKDLDRDALIQCLYSSELAAPPMPPPSASEVPKMGSPPTKLECMSTDDIIAHFHHPESCLLPIRPCDTPNSSDTKTTYTPEELHCLTGCHTFCNYHHIILTTKDSTLINTGKFPLSLGIYATIPQAPRGKANDKLPAKYLDIVHVDIAFGDCVSVRCFKFALIFVNRATCYNWTFGLKSLQTMTSNRPSLLFAMKPAT
jgi:hypothetical protein